MSNIKKGLLNSWVMFLTTFVTLALTFIQRTFFIRYLGETALGLNSLFNSILSAISITDIGLDTVLLFVLFKPLKNNDSEYVYSLVILIRKMYLTIAGLIAVIGMIVVPFLPLIINGARVSAGVVTIYILYLLNAIVSYTFAEYRVLLNANQQSYIVSSVTFLVTSAMTIVQIVIIAFTHSFIFFEIVQIFGTLLIGVLLYVFSKKKVSYKKSSRKITRKTKMTIFKNGVGGLSNRIGTFVVFGSDSVLLSIFTNIVTVARYSNYMMIVNAAVSLVLKSLAALMPSIGHQVVTQSDQERAPLFENFSYAIYLISFVIFGEFLFNASPFVSLWIGERQTLPKLTVFLLAINLATRTARLGPLNYIDALGLQWAQRWKPIVEAIVNLCASLIFILVFKLGLNGILLGTLFSNFTTVVWMEPQVVFRNGVLFRKRFMVAVFRFIVLMCAASGVYSAGFSGLTSSSILDLVKNIVVSTAIICIIIVAEWCLHKTIKKFGDLI